MEIEIKALSPELLPDYLHFFDDVAFADHPEWSFCYCTYYHLDTQEEKRLEERYAGRWTRDVLRDIAIGLIQNGPAARVSGLRGRERGGLVQRGRQGEL